MEIGLEKDIPTYSGGLGILAGDTIKSASDLSVPMVAVTLLYRKGYFRQELDEKGNQIEMYDEWDPSSKLRKLDKKIYVYIEGRKVAITAWQYDVKGSKGYSVPVIFLDTRMDENSSYDGSITDCLYAGDQKYRFAQEMVLGIGGVRMLKALGYRKIEKYHMNEGHSSLLTLELIRREMGTDKNISTKHLKEVHKKCIFTTHTPVPAGHDKHPSDIVESMIERVIPIDEIKSRYHEGKLNMTYLAMDNSQYINGVAKRHGEVSRDMFPGYNIDYITNGVHSRTWSSDSFKELYDRNIRGWQQDPFSLRYALNIDNEDLWQAHMDAKNDMINHINKLCGSDLKDYIFTIGFARRSTAYKRADLLFQDIGRLLKISNDIGKIQVIYGGKAHPRDTQGKDVIRNIFSKIKELEGKIDIVFVEDYNMEIAKKLVSGVDVWLNTPQRPLEASGTSGMKAAHNGVLNLSILDGWWLEGYIEGLTGWYIGSKELDNSNWDDANDLYDKLEHTILPKYYHDRDNWINMMKHSIALNASFFNTHRMIQQYVLNAYFR